MKLWLIYIAVFALGLTGFTVMMSSAASPEKVILGPWDEKTWMYENNTSIGADIMAASKTSQTNSQPAFSLHEAENWEFLPDGKLRLTVNDEIQQLTWTIKGRGHVLQIKYADGHVENYQLTELNKDKMVLDAESDVQARGIARLTFERNKTNTYAQEIQ